MNTRLSLLSILAWMSLILVPCQSFAQKGLGGGPGLNVRQKAQDKEGSRWTLQEWLAQKDRNMMMDLWLGMYAPSPYEFFVSGSYLSYDKKVSTEPQQSAETSRSFESSQGSLGAYATVVGLEAEYENNTKENLSDLSGSLNLRVLGNAVQGTHLILHYGLRTRAIEGSPLLRHQFAGADLNLYLMKHFGLQGLYRVYFPTHDEQLGDVEGSRSEAGLFLDFGPLRVFGQWYSDLQRSEKSSIRTNLERTGVQSGLKFFF